MESRILVELVTRRNGTQLIADFNNIREKTEPLLKQIVSNFSDFTDHGIHHSETVVSKFDLILTDQLLISMNDFELFFLLCSAFLHDIGMLDFSQREEMKDCYKSNKNELNFRAQEIRDKHHLYSEMFINHFFKDLMIKDQYQAFIIGRICRGHRKEILLDSEVFNPDFIYKDSSINIPFLACILKIADELDLTFERAPPIIYEHLEISDEISKTEWKKHLSVSGVALSAENPLIIKCSVLCRDPTIHRLLKNLENKIDNDLEELPYLMYKYSNYRKEIPRKFIMEINSEGYIAYDLKFSLQEQEIVKLLMGKRMYKRKEESIREILKNSIDSCRLRKEISKVTDMDYNPKITFQVNSEENWVKVTDNGFGMDIDIVERYLTKIGKSFFQSPEFLEKSIDFTPLSELGIGILSIFMIADKIMINTKTKESNPIQIVIENLVDYFIVSPGDIKETGTEITLDIKENLINEINFENEIKHYVRHLEFPIRLFVDDKYETVVRDEGMLPDLRTKEIFQKFKIAAYEVEFEEEEFAGKMTILGDFSTENEFKPFIEENPKIVAHYDDYEDQFGFRIRREKKNIDEDLKREFLKNCSISYQGIFVTNELRLIPSFLRKVYLFLDINLKTKNWELNIARNEITVFDGLQNISEYIAKVFCNHFFNYILESDSKLDFKYKTKKNNIILQYFRILRHHYYSHDEYDLEIQQIIPYLKEHVYHECLLNKKRTIMSYNDIVNSGFEYYVLHLNTNMNMSDLNIFFINTKEYKNDIIYIVSFYWGTVSRIIDWRRIFKTKVLEIKSLVDINHTKIKLDFIPSSWKIYKFNMKNNQRLIEIVESQGVILNIDNRFLKFLSDKRDIISQYKEISMAVEGFFRQLRRNLKNNFNKVIENQKSLLDFFVKEKIIAEEEATKLILSEKDFPEVELNKFYRGLNLGS